MGAFIDVFKILLSPLSLVTRSLGFLIKVLGVVAALVLGPIAAALVILFPFIGAVLLATGGVILFGAAVLGVGTILGSFVAIMTFAATSNSAFGVTLRNLTNTFPLLSVVTNRATAAYGLFQPAVRQATKVLTLFLTPGLTAATRMASMRKLGAELSIVFTTMKKSLFAMTGALLASAKAMLFKFAVDAKSFVLQKLLNVTWLKATVRLIRMKVATVASVIVTKSLVAADKALVALGFLKNLQIKKTIALLTIQNARNKLNLIWTKAQGVATFLLTQAKLLFGSVQVASNAALATNTVLTKANVVALAAQKLGWVTSIPIIGTWIAGLFGASAANVVATGTTIGLAGALTFLETVAFPIIVILLAIAAVVLLIIGAFKILGKIISAISSGIGSFFGSIGGFFGAEGGIVTKPTLSIIGESGPEAVVPLNQAPGARPLGGGGGGGSTGTGGGGGGGAGGGVVAPRIVVPITLELNGIEMARIVKEIMTEDLVRNFNTPSGSLRGAE